MPFARPPLSALRTQVAQDIAAALPGSDPLLRFSNLGIIGTVLAGLAHLHYGYLDWIAAQAVPYTATGEFLEAWAALKDVYRLPAARAAGAVVFTGTNGTDIPAGTPLVRADGQKFTSTATATVLSGVALVPAQADADPAGLVGAIGNTPAGSPMILGQTIAGINSAGVVGAAFFGGADLETDTSLRARMLRAYQNPPAGGNAGDYATWTLAVPGVTRVWVVPAGYGPGTVVVYPMLDLAQVAFNGFPQGTNGCATGEARDSAATGDQLAVANYIYPRQPVTALVYVVAPVANTVNFSISGIASASTATKNAIRAAVAGVFADQGAATGSTVTLSAIDAAIAAVPGSSGFSVDSPTVNVTSSVGQLPVVGTITYT